MLTSQYGCYHSGQEAPGIDRHVENGEELLPLLALEVTGGGNNVRLDIMDP